METIKTPCGHEFDEEICPTRHKTQVEFKKLGRRVDFPGCITCPHFVTKSADKPQEEKLKNKSITKITGLSAGGVRVCLATDCSVVISKTNTSGLCRKHSCEKNRKQIHKAKSITTQKQKNKAEKTAKNMPASQLCREHNIQHCHACDDLTCGDNMQKPAADTIHASSSKIECDYGASAQEPGRVMPLYPQDDIYRRALRRYGDHFQIMKTAEEAAELAAAIARYMSPKSWGNTNPLIAMTEELADVEIMCQQMRLIFGNQPVDAAKKMKLERLEKRLNDED